MVEGCVNYMGKDKESRFRDAYKLAISEDFSRQDEYWAKVEELGEEHSQEKRRELRDLRSRLFSE